MAEFCFNIKTISKESIFNYARRMVALFLSQILAVRTMPFGSSVRLRFDA